MSDIIENGIKQIKRGQVQDSQKAIDGMRKGVQKAATLSDINAKMDCIIVLQRGQMELQREMSDAICTLLKTMRSDDRAISEVMHMVTGLGSSEPSDDPSADLARSNAEAMLKRAQKKRRLGT